MTERSTNFEGSATFTIEPQEFARLFMRFDTMSKEHMIELALKGLLYEEAQYENEIQYALNDDSITIEVDIDPNSYEILGSFTEERFLELLNAKRHYADWYFRALVDEVPTQIGFYTLRFVCSAGGVVEHIRQKIWIVRKYNTQHEPA